MSINRDHRQEFESAGIEHVRKIVAAGLYSGKKLKDARAWLDETDTKYPRRADIKGTIAVIISAMALIVSAAAVVFTVWHATHGASAYLTEPKESAPLKSGSIVPTPAPK
jgi:hypothetical protein